MLGRTLSYFNENGAYVLFSTLALRPFQAIHNRLLAGKLGVRRLHIGPRAYLQGLSCISMGEDFMAGEGLWLHAVTRYGIQQFSPRLVIGDHVRVSHWSHIACTNSITIGNHVLIGSKVFITDHNHGSLGESAASPTIPPAERPLEGNRSVRIEENVWLGDGVVVCPGVTIGEGSVAAANAVVTTDVPPFTLVGGVPARAIRRYDATQGRWIRA
jgi:lipopolysaccharide O-acetyltransferase